MSSSLRELRERRQSVSATKKITRAMELIASSRIVKAQQAAKAAVPYTRELTRAVSMLASAADLEHPLLVETEKPQRSAVLLMTSDRGLAGAYSANAIKLGEQVRTHLMDEEGQEVDLFITGNKGVGYHEFRGNEIVQSWTGFTDSPKARDAKVIADELLKRFLTPTEEGGVDEIHMVGTRFVSMLTQQPRATRLLPLVVEDATENVPPTRSPADDSTLFYEFEPDAKTVLDALLPLFVTNRIHTALLQSSASELASRQQAMKAATDNASSLIDDLTRQANQARQAEITQEITEIVGGASALSESA
ncbi:MAG: F0F1 ATP synthase subunit gamma [Propionibacterium sp.]|nr:F0F1 ATP synthase subunit gamma [Propionibacterium sp.]